MTTERDREMEALLRAETPPDHRPRFWDDVRADLGASDGASVTSMKRHRRRGPWLLAAAAVVVIGAVVGFGALRDPSTDVDVTTDPTIDDGDPEPPPHDSSTTVPDGAERGSLMPDGDPIDRGSGRVVGVSPDGRWLYVAEDDGDGELGCEGSRRLALFVESVDGGERRLAAPLADLDATTISELHFDGAGRVATVEQCEGSNARIVAATVADDGSLTDLSELTLPEPECQDGTFQGIGDVDYVAAGELVAAVMSRSAGGRMCGHLYSLPDRASEPTLIDEGSVFQVEVGPNGELFTATLGGTIALDGTEIYQVDGLDDMALSPSGSSLAISEGQGDDVILHIDGGEVAGSSTFAISAVDVELIDDRTGAMIVFTGDELSLTSLYVDGDDTPHSLAEGNVVDFVLSPDGSRIFVSIADDDGTNVRLLEQPLTR